eukprot:CAMPEP_0203001444 /NCGR_PEP_ID=MMETSP1401-20130829/570_1 /ASSEMBLY_ACC=CAM_ASM_000894 /TAXON_ID=38833 /ORGANISM="Micromonas pusilla, Strain CCAC1681" /LENGTH=136 /DNA_ID=CAMNT_0049742917 /DNA_START=6 /DNA_END=416 /DNA_ORIENTATION=+
MEDMSVTAPVSQPEMSTLNEPLFWNSPAMPVIAETSQSCISVLQAGPQFAPPEEQQFSPEDTAERQYSTAAFNAFVPVNGYDVEQGILIAQAPGGPAFRSVESAYMSPVHVPGSNELSYPQLVYLLVHAVASVNIS